MIHNARPHLVVLQGGLSEEPLDDELAEAAWRGDAAAARRLFDRHGPAVRRLLASALCDSLPVDELTHGVFLSFFARRGRERIATMPEHELLSLAARAALEELQSRAPSPRRRIPSGTWGSDGEAAIEDLDADLADVDRALRGLAPEVRVAFALHYVEGFTETQVARAMKWSLVATRRRVEQARVQVWQVVSSNPLLGKHVGVGHAGEGSA